MSSSRSLFGAARSSRSRTSASRTTPFVDSLNPLQATPTPAEQLWADTEGHRRYVDLLNRAMNKYLGRHRIFFDSRHKRYHFAVVTAGEDRVFKYRPLNNKQDVRNVAWCPRIKKTGERRPYWWHLAAGLRFERVAAKQWHLAIRPERHITKDGSTPIDPEKVGPRVTRLKAKMYNDAYLAEVQFWRDVLCEGGSAVHNELRRSEARVRFGAGHLQRALAGRACRYDPVQKSEVRGRLVHDGGPREGSSRRVRTPMRTTTSRRAKVPIKPLELDRLSAAARWLGEPSLYFQGDHTNVDPKVGIPLYGPRSCGTSRHKQEIHVGFIGTGEAVDQAAKFLEDCSDGVDGDETHAPFPGCKPDRGFRLALRMNEQIIEKITRQESQQILGIRTGRSRFEQMLGLLENKLEVLSQRDHPLDYVMLVLPQDLYLKCRSVNYTEKRTVVNRNLRRAFKAIAMRHRKPTQILQDTTTGLVKSSRDPRSQVDDRVEPVYRDVLQGRRSTVGPCRPSAGHLLHRDQLLSTTGIDLEPADQRGAGVR